MKRNSAGAAFLTPDANGWRVRLADGVLQNAKSLEEAEEPSRKAVGEQDEGKR